MAVYGLNGICPNNKSMNINEQLYDFKKEDKESLIETVIYSMQNDNDALFEYCMEFSDPQVLQESLMDIKKTIIKAIKTIWQKIKNAFNAAVKAIKRFLTRIGFITDKNGKLNASAVKVKQYTSLADLADEELSKEIDVPEYDIKGNYSTMVAGVFGSIVNCAKQLVFERDPKTIEEMEKRERDIKGVKERVSTYMSQLTDITNRDMLKTVKKNKLDKEEIDFIVENSAYTPSELEKILKDQYDYVEKDLNDYIKELSKNSITFDNKDGQEVTISADPKRYSKFEQFVNKNLLDISNLLEQGYLKFSSAVETYIVQCCTAKKQLEGELLKKQNPES